MSRLTNLVLPLALVAAAASADTNPDSHGFHDGLDGWTVIGVGTVSWSAEDAAGNPLSGSVELRDDNPDEDATRMGLERCIVLTGVGSPLAVSAKALVRAEGEPHVEARIRYREFLDPTCRVESGFERLQTINRNDPDWLHFEDVYTPVHPRTLAVKVGLGIARAAGAGPGGVVMFDDLKLGSTVQLTRWTIDAGGGRASGGAIELAGTIGQPDAGSAAGGPIELLGGFWFAAGGGPGESIFGNGFESP